MFRRSCVEFFSSCSTLFLRFYSNRNIMKLHEKGMFHDMFPNTASQEITDLCNSSSQCVYAGFDPTAKSLHVGNLLVLINLLHWQRSGHQVIALIGGATGRIGDPSGRSKERELLEEGTVLSNVKSISVSIQRIFENHEKYFWKDKDILKPVIIEDNYSWYSSQNCIDFLSRIGRHFRVGTMMSRSSVASRLNSEVGISFTEFSYQILQSFDWLHLLKKYNCRFQIGGSDQMGNIMSGHELITRSEGTSVFGLTLPLITTQAGDKFGKSAGNAVWLDPELTQPFELYQFFMRLPDAKIPSLLPLLTFLNVGQAKELIQRHEKNPEQRVGQNFLAEQITLLVHGEEGLSWAKKASYALYSTDLKTLAELNVNEMKSIFRGAPQIELLLKPGVTVLEAALSARCFLQRNDADRIIRAGGFYVNHNRCTNPEEVLVEGLHILPNDTSLFRVGKKNYWIVIWKN